MVGLGRKGETFVECPFCEKGQVRTFHKEGYIQGKQSRISAGGKFTFHSVPDTYEVLEDCPNCGKNKKEIQAYLDGKLKKKIDPEKLKKRLAESGLPTNIEFNVS